MTTTRALLALLIFASAPASSLAQEPSGAARMERLRDEAQAHRRAGRHALAAERFLELHQAMSAEGHPRASVALWSAGRSFNELPGREAEAVEVLRRFLAESTALATDPEMGPRVSQWRSEAVSMIEELEARAPDARPPPSPASTPEEPEQRPSPVGPVMLAGGGAILVTGVIVGAFALGQAAEFRDLCDDLSMCPTSLRPQYDEMRTYGMVADILMVAGGAIAAAGLVLTFVLTEDVEATASAACTTQGCFAFARGTF